MDDRKNLPDLPNVISSSEENQLGSFYRREVALPSMAGAERSKAMSARCLGNSPTLVLFDPPMPHDSILRQSWLLIRQRMPQRAQSVACTAQSILGTITPLGATRSHCTQQLRYSRPWIAPQRKRSAASKSRTRTPQDPNAEYERRNTGTNRFPQPVEQRDSSPKLKMNRQTIATARAAYDIRAKSILVLSDDRVNFSPRRGQSR